MLLQLVATVLSLLSAMATAFSAWMATNDAVSAGSTPAETRSLHIAVERSMRCRAGPAGQQGVQMSGIEWARAAVFHSSVFIYNVTSAIHTPPKQQTVLCCMSSCLTNEQCTHQRSHPISVAAMERKSD